ILIPADVTLVMIRDQHASVRRRPMLRTRYLLASLRKMHPGPGPAVRVGTGIHRVLQQTQQRVITGRLPSHGVARAIKDGWKLDLLGTEPEVQPARATELVE